MCKRTRPQKAQSRATVGLLLGLMGLTLASAGWTLRDPHQAELRARAEKIFTYDRQNGHTLPAHRLRALSIALEFYDHESAQQILSQLEPALQLPPKTQ
ncbi:hypothetical protein WDW37_07625 [Bdellovibrionota bacterium FG-1]